MSSNSIDPQTLLRVENKIRSDPNAFSKFITDPKDFLHNHGVAAPPELLKDIADAIDDGRLTPENFNAMRVYIRKRERERDAALAIISAFP